MQTNKIFLIIALCYLTAYFAHALFLKKTVYGDGIFYYSWVRSVVVDRTIDFTNEYAQFQVSQPKTALGLLGNKYTIGPPLLWLPVYVLIHSLAGGSGYELPYQLAVGLTGVFYTITGLVLLFILLKKFFSESASLAAIIATAGATNLLFYGSLDPVNSHAVSFFAAVLFLTFLFGQKRASWFLIGCALGLVALVRTQDVIIGLLVLPYIKPKNVALFLLGACVVFLPQLVAWQLLYGTFWVSPYINSFEGFNVFQPHLFGVLFSLQNGLVLWTPMVLLGFIGLWMKQGTLPLKLMAITLLIQLYAVASWSTWWQGASYSGRMFVSTLPLLSFGLSTFLSKFQLYKFKNITIYWSLILPLCTINVLLIVYFLLTHS